MSDISVTIGTQVASAKAGASLIEVCEEIDADVPFSCRGGSCGTCIIRVLEGESHLSEPTGNEEVVIEEFGQQPGRLRLACQIQVFGDIQVEAYQSDLRTDEER